MTSTLQSAIKRLSQVPSHRSTTTATGLSRLTRLRPCIVIPPRYSNSLRCYSTTKTADPLRILFCGSDQFSINALQALHAARQTSPETIEAIDVVCRPAKRVGARLKKIREVPIKGVAKELELPVHDVDTFTGWTPPNPFNLIIAVSFGLLVPKRLICAAKYGGLNLHPSLLPDFRGPAPLHHTLLHGETRTGVSLQTLHPERFDHGVILAQEEFEIPDPGECTVPTLTDLVSIVGADMLVAAIRDKLFVPPLRPVKSWVDGESTDELRHAPKIQKEDMHVDWRQWDANVIDRRNRILGPLWSFAVAQSGKDGEAQIRKMRIIMDYLKPVDVKHEETLLKIQQRLGLSSKDIPPATPFALLEDINRGAGDGSQPIFVKTCDEEILQIDTIKVEGSKVAPAYRASMKAKLFAENPVVKDGDICGILYFRDTLS